MTTARQSPGSSQGAGSGAVLLLVPLVVLMMALVLIAAFTSLASAQVTNCTTPGAADAAAAADPGATTADLNGEQLGYATTIVQVAARLRLPAAAARIAVAVSLQESTLRNLTWGDRDSLGLFQQRDAWGSRAARLDPATAAAMFYTGGRAGQPGLTDIEGWESMPLTVAAQAVQVSATPTAYAKWAGLSGRVVAQIWPTAATTGAAAPDIDAALAGLHTDDAGAKGSTPPTGCSDADGSPATTAGMTGVPADLLITGSPAGQAAVRQALAQLGKPYRWGATGPDDYDCSGLTMSAWAAAGQQLPRTTSTQIDSGAPVPGGLTHAVGGDLVFIPGADGTFANPRHVGMIVGYRAGDGPDHLWIIHAPSTGRPVQLTVASNWSGEIAALRHID